jgi:hypothetical protein
MNDDFKKLLARCKCGVFLIVNEHRDYYETAEQKLEELSAMECPPDIDADVRKVMIETDTIVSLQFYPDTPIGSYSIYHYDVDAAIQRALSCLD